MIIILIIGILFGFVQGFLISYLKIQPFIVTLAGMFFARGMTAIISVDMISIKNDLFLKWANAKIYLPFGSYVNKKGEMIYPYIYPTVVMALIVLILMFVLLKYTKFGRSVYAIGGSEQSALLMGLNVRRTKMKVYILHLYCTTKYYYCSKGKEKIEYCMNCCYMVFSNYKRLFVSMCIWFRRRKYFT